MIALFAASALAYMLSSGLYLASLIQATEAMCKRALWANCLSAALHALHLAIGLQSGAITTLQASLSGLALGLSVGFLLAQLWRHNLAVLGAFVMPISLFFLLGSALPSSHDFDPGRSLLLPIHVAVCVGGLVAFGLACTSSLAYVIHERALRAKHMRGVVKRLPALHVLETFSLRAVLIGFPLLTIGILTGSAWAFQLHEEHLQFSPTQILACVAWLLFGAVLLSRLALGWRGRRAAYGTIAGFACAGFVLIGYVLRSGSP